MRWATLFFCAMSFAAAASVIEDLELTTEKRVVLGQGDGWQAVRILSGNSLRLEFVDAHDTKKVISRYLASGIGFVSRAEVARFNGRDHLITVWQDTNRITALRIFDPRKKDRALVFEKRSMGEIEYEIHGDTVTVTAQQADPKSMGLKETKTKWPEKPQ